MLGFKMAAEVDFPLEGTAAVGAGERFEARVLATVRDEIGALAERLPALLTLVGLLSCNKTHRAEVREGSVPSSG